MWGPLQFLTFFFRPFNPHHMNKQFSKGNYSVRDIKFIASLILLEKIFIFCWATSIFHPKPKCFLIWTTSLAQQLNKCWLLFMFQLNSLNISIFFLVSIHLHTWAELNMKVLNSFLDAIIIFCISVGKKVKSKCKLIHNKGHLGFW